MTVTSTVRSAHVPEATLEDFEELTGLVNMGKNPILPQPEWGQDAAFIAFVIDGLRKSNGQMFRMLERFVDEYDNGQCDWSFPSGDGGGMESLVESCACGAETFEYGKTVENPKHQDDCVWDQARRFLEEMRARTR
jgi:hypothetical protein